jgi:hypothetical protein
VWRESALLKNFLHRFCRGVRRQYSVLRQCCCVLGLDDLPTFVIREPPKLKDDLETRLEWSEKLGVGFKIVPMSEFKIRKLGKPRGWVRKTGVARRLTVSQKRQSY